MAIPPAPTNSRRHPTGFTVIELAVVVAIIAILIGMVIVVGGKVIDSTRERATKQTLLALDAALAEYMAAKEGKLPPPLVTYHFDANTGLARKAPLADGSFAPSANNVRPIPSTALLLKELATVPAADKLVKSIPSRFLRFSPTQIAAGDPPIDDPNPVQLTEVLDAWGHPIRFVHPAYDGLLFDRPDVAVPSRAAPRELRRIIDGELVTNEVPNDLQQVRRNNFVTWNESAAPVPSPDADGGLCPGNRPYFYSTGPDAKAGFLRENRAGGRVVVTDLNADNVYSTEVQIVRDPASN